MNATLSADGKSSDQVFDVVVVGAGWAGMYALIKMRELGLDVIVLEAGGGVGGTWYWNRYPGARCDVRSIAYSYSFSPELEQEWTWSERYAAQPEIERYANYVADKFDLRRSIRLNTRVISVVYDEGENRWRTTTEAGDVLFATYCIMAVGGYSQPLVPNIPGIEEFAGESYYTTQWPTGPVEFAGKRIGVIGNGASGIQAVTAIAKQSVDHLYLFHRTPNYVVPAHNQPMNEEYVRHVKSTYHEIRENTRWSGSGALYEGPRGPVADLDEDEFQKRMAEVWEIGGSSICGGVTDLMSDIRGNRRVADYIRAKVHEVVHDQEVADLICPPVGQLLGARRVLVETEYFDAINRPNVTVVDVRSDAIRRILPSGLATGQSTFDLDILVYATGFDSGTGAVLQVDIRGRDGQSLASHWAEGPSTYLGLMVSGFPNMFLVAGAGSPGIRSNVIVSIEQHVEWIAEFTEHLLSRGVTVAEAAQEAETLWTDHLNSTVARTLLMEEDTQYFGCNVPGKPRRYLAYIGGVGTYRKICDAVRDRGYEGFLLYGESDQTASRAWSGPPVDQAAALSSRFGTSVI